MVIDTIVMGDYQTNCYCVRNDKDAAECLIIDPGLQPEPLVLMLQQNDFTPVDILLTHGHVDHIGGIESIREHWPKVRVAIHKDDAGMLTSPAENLSLMAGSMVQARPAEILLDSEKMYYQAVDLRFQIIHTPGHSPGSICLYSAQDHILFGGDTLFAGSVGRTDFPGGSYELLIEMIQQKLLILPDQTQVYTGHGPATTIENEKKFNPFLT
ncbi:MAG: MBL fold metallo-hydrolase [Planctomycetota bacterium]|jgi:glyoxylase-like metal-dependent hydrolase (beta-lactamase superfamily II)